MEEKKEVIGVNLTLQRETAKEFKVSERSVQSAMRFETNSSSAHLLRAYTLDHGGRQYRITAIKERVENPYTEVVALKWQKV